MLVISEGSVWVARYAKGRRDPVRYTVKAITDHTIHITSPENKMGSIFQLSAFIKLFVPAQ